MSLGEELVRLRPKPMSEGLEDLTASLCDWETVDVVPAREEDAPLAERSVL